MPHVVTLISRRIPFRVYGLEEAKRKGFVDSWRRDGSHDPVAGPFKHGEGDLLKAFLDATPDALAVETKRGEITAYRPKKKLLQ